MNSVEEADLAVLPAMFHQEIYREEPQWPGGHPVAKLS